MKKGFTILELLVASLLLGMLMTVLTMIFNQSSISWRVGEASVADLDDVSDGISRIHHEADNLYVWNNKTYSLLSVWDEDEKLRDGERLISDTDTFEKIDKLSGCVNDSTKPGQWGTENVGSDQTDSGFNVYTVNVKSAGPNRQWNDWDDIWSFPDDFD